MNNMGDYVGWHLNAGVYTGFIFDSKGVSAIMVPDAASGVGTHPEGVNDASQVVGYYQTASGSVQGFIEKSGVYSTLSFPGAKSTLAFGINDSGKVVGYYVDSAGVTHGFIEQGGVYTTLDVPGAAATYILGINGLGQVVGSYFDGTQFHGFTYNGVTFENADYSGAADSFARNINDSGQIVGWHSDCPTCMPDGYTGFYGGFYDVRTVAGLDTYLVGISDLGVILGDTMLGPTWLSEPTSGSPGSGTTPPPPPPAIPEAGTSLLMAGGGALLIALGRLRRRS
jgi:probable HAF family extracellular repeat protein